MHFRLARNKGATYVTLLWIASQKWIVADINEYHSLSLSSFSETKMRANVTHKHHPTLSLGTKRGVYASQKCETCLRAHAG